LTRTTNHTQPHPGLSRGQGPSDCGETIAAMSERKQKCKIEIEINAAVGITTLPDPQNVTARVSFSKTKDGGVPFAPIFSLFSASCTPVGQCYLSASPHPPPIFFLMALEFRASCIYLPCGRIQLRWSQHHLRTFFVYSDVSISGLVR